MCHLLNTITTGLAMSTCDVLQSWSYNEYWHGCDYLWQSARGFVSVDLNRSHANIQYNHIIAQVKCGTQLLYRTNQ